MSTNADLSVDVLQRAREAKTIRGLHNCLNAAKDRVTDAKAIPWPALADSWQRTYEAIEAMCLEREGGKSYPDIVERAKALRAHGMTYAAIGKEIGVAAGTVHHYVRGRNAAREMADA